VIQDVKAFPISFYFNPIEYRNGLYLNADLARRTEWNEAAMTARTEKMLKEVKSILSLRSSS